MKTKKKFIVILIATMLFFSSIVVTASNRIDLVFKGADIRDVLNTIANLAEVNLVADQTVRGEITIKLNELSFDQALSLITKVTGLEYFWDNNTVIVASPERIKELYGVDDVTESIRINYANPQELETIINQLVEEVSISVSEQNNNIIIKGREDRVDKGIELIEELDIPKKQVLIDVTVEEISRNHLEDIGVSTDDLSNIRFLRSQDSIEQGNEKLLGSVIGVDVSFPNMLRALKTEGKAKTLANPSLMALDREQANLLIGDKIPIQLSKSNDDGIVENNIEYVDVGIVLDFLPRITDDGTVTLEVNPRISTLGQRVSGGSLPAINTREASTKIRLHDGQTFAIGGLIQDDVIESYSKVPLLSDIPLLGGLFKHRDIQNITTEVIIFITPHIINDIEEGEEEEIREKEKVTKEEKIKKEEDIQKNDSTKENFVSEKENQAEFLKNSFSKYESAENNSGEFVRLTDEELAKILGNSHKKRNKKQPFKEKEAKKQNEVDNIDTLKSEVEESKIEKKNINSKEFLESTRLVIPYTVKQNEDKENILEKYNLTDMNLIEGEIYEGSLVKVFVPFNRVYYIKKGETLYGISRKFNIPIELLKEINSINDVRNISTGTAIVLPEKVND
ncbi:MAG: secretin N-terminal domain-containing protein [bacterium]